MSWSAVTWLLLAGAPLLGVLAIISLAVFHEHGEPVVLAGAAVGGATTTPVQAAGLSAGRWARVFQSARRPVDMRRAGTRLLEDYLLDDIEATVSDRRQRQARLLTPAVRATTWVLEEYLAERGASLPARPVRPRTPILAPAPASRVFEAPVAVAAVPIARPIRAPRAVRPERSPWPTRLEPLGAEIAIG